MKQYLFLLIPFFLFACSKGPSSESLALEKDALKCWNESWSKKPGYDITKGITLLDDYLYRKGLLGKRTVEDYKTFFNQSTIVHIPDSVKGSKEMNEALNSEFEGAPDVVTLGSCWQTNWFKKLNTVDTSDVLYRTGSMVKSLAESGNPDFNRFSEDFFKGLTQEEIDRPLVKAVAYFVFWKTRNGDTHIQFVH